MKAVMALCFAWWALQPFKTFAARRNEVVIGQSADLSQETASQVFEFRAGLQVWLDKVNSGGGVAGLPIVLRSLDDARRLERVVANTKELIHGHVSALIGYRDTEPTLAALTISERA